MFSSWRFDALYVKIIKRILIIFPTSFAAPSFKKPTRTEGISIEYLWILNEIDAFHGGFFTFSSGYLAFLG